MQRLLAIALAVLAATAAVTAEDQKPQVTQSTSGNFTNINVVGKGTYSEVIARVKAMAFIPASRDAEVIADLKANANTNPPPFLFELARRTLPTDKAEASYYAYLADIRTRYDTRRCKDKSAGGGYGMMLMELRSQLAPLLEEWKKSPDYKEKVYTELQSRDEVFASKASPWWICSHGMRAVMAALKNETLKSDDWLKPESEWMEIQTDIRNFVAAKGKEPAAKH